MYLLTLSSAITNWAKTKWKSFRQALHHVLYRSYCKHIDPAKLISSIEPLNDSGEVGRYVEIEGDLFRLVWTLDTEADIHPSPTDSNFDIWRVSMSKSMRKTWSNSVLMDHGANSCIRSIPSDPVHVIKLAHPTPAARAELSHEFEMMKELSQHSSPIPQFDPDPLVDEDGIYGYKMSKLKKLDFSQLEKYSADVEEAVSAMHAAGFSHGDLHPSNIMLNKEQRIVFIDPSYAGLVGDDVVALTPTQHCICRHGHSVV